jgi:hypothetical protein
MYKVSSTKWVNWIWIPVAVNNSVSLFLLPPLFSTRPNGLLACTGGWGSWPWVKELSTSNDLSMYLQIEINWRLFHAWLLPMPVKRMMGLENPQRICVQYVLKLSILQAQKPRKVLLGFMSRAFFPATRKPSSLNMNRNSCVLRCCYSWLSPEITLPRFNFTPTTISIAPTINSPPQNILCVPFTHSAPRGRWGIPWRSFAISKRFYDLGSLWRIVVWRSTISFVVSQIDILTIVEGHHTAETLVYFMPLSSRYTLAVIAWIHHLR